MKKEIGLLGCRVRPFMENAFRHGYDVIAADGFNDWDAQKFGKLLTAGSLNPSCYPDVLKRYRDMDGCPIIFCGPVEVDATLIERAAKERNVRRDRNVRREGVQILNAPASAIAKSRSYDFLKQVATGGIVLPKRDFGYAPTGGNLIKDFSSAGGVGVMQDIGAKLLAGQYRQQAVDGLSVGATFLTVNNGRTIKNGRTNKSSGTLSTRLMGITEHINRVSDFGQSGYHYGGVVYPADVESVHERAIKKFGERAASQSGLTGWWGADFILNKYGTYLLEINPRFTSSAELIAIAHDIDLIGSQSSAINGGRVDLKVGEPRSYTATAVCYAKDDCVFNDAQKWFELGARDIPHDGSVIKQGEPVISLYATTDSFEKCMSSLKTDAAKLYRELNSPVNKQ